MTTDPLLAWAQDHFLHGHLLAYWITDYIDLEESLAVGSIAQEELAHAALLLELAGYDAAGRDQIVYSWDPALWSPAELVTRQLDDWPSTVLRGLLMSTAAAARTGWMTRAAPAARRDAAGVLRAEQRLHITHWERWAFRLSRDPRTGNEIRAASAALLPLAADLLDGAGDDEQAARQVHRAWARDAADVLGRVGLPADLLAVAPRPRRRYAGLDAILSSVRELRTTPEDGVVGMYR